MEDRDDKRSDEIVKMPESLEEADQMLSRVQYLQDNLKISSSDGSMSGNIDTGFSFNQ